MFFGSRQSNGNRCIAVEGCLSDLIAVFAKTLADFEINDLAINSIPIAPHPRGTLTSEDIRLYDIPY